MHRLELRIPPPIIALVMMLLMTLLAQTLPAVTALAPMRRPLAIGVALIGLCFDAAGLLAFRRARTTINPLRPANTSALVTTGVYRITRNPMYVGLLLMLLAWAIWLGSPVSLAGPVLFIVCINRLQIQPEERILLDKYGSEYRNYLSRVRRWL